MTIYKPNQKACKFCHWLDKCIAAGRIPDIVTDTLARALPCQDFERVPVSDCDLES